MASTGERPPRHEREWPVIALWVTAAMLIAILATALTATGTEGRGRDARARLGEATEGTLLFRTLEQELLLPAPRLKTDVGAGHRFTSGQNEQAWPLAVKFFAAHLKGRDCVPNSTQ